MTGQPIPFSLGPSSAVLVLCLNLGRTYTFHCRRKSQAALEVVGFSCQCLVLVDLTLNQRVQSSSLRRPTKTYLVAGLCIIRQSGATRINNPRVTAFDYRVSESGFADPKLAISLRNENECAGQGCSNVPVDS